MPASIAGRILLNQFQVEEFTLATPLGEQYRAVDLYRNKSLSLILLPGSVSNRIDRIQELETTSSFLRGIRHANLLRYLGIFQTPELAFFLEEWVDGPSLKEVIGQGPVSVTEGLIFIKALCAALNGLHTRGYVHLNLCPELIRIDRRGRIMLGGLSAARPMGGGNYKDLNKYPPLFHSPEQFLGLPVSTSADVYSLAVIHYQLTTGAWINGKAPPKSMEAIRRAHLEKIPPAPASLQRGIPDHLSRMMLWALRKDPNDRLKNTTELSSSLMLAARITDAEIPSTVNPEQAPVTFGILSEWEFPPSRRVNLIAADTPPLEDRLASIVPAAPKKSRIHLRLRPAILTIVAAGLIFVFWFMQPQSTPTTDPAPSLPPSVIPPSRQAQIPATEPNKERGGQIAFTCTREDFNQLCMVNRDGTGMAQLTNMQASNYYPVFSPDGRGLLFSSNRNGLFDLYLLLFDEKELIQLTDRVGNVVSPDYSPDGLTIVFANRTQDRPTAIWMVDADGANPRMIYQGPDSIVAVAWSPDGKRIAYAMPVGIPLEYEIFTMNRDGANHRRLTQGLRGIGGSLDWSPDGTSLLVYAGPYNDKDIFKLDALTGQYTQLTDGGNNAAAAYSPDGRYIVFNSLRNEDQADLYIMRADGTNPQQLTNHPEPDWGAHWSP